MNSRTRSLLHSLRIDVIALAHHLFWVLQNDKPAHRKALSHRLGHAFATIERLLADGTVDKESFEKERQRILAIDDQ